MVDSTARFKSCWATLFRDRPRVQADGGVTSCGGLLPQCEWWCKVTGMPRTKVGKLAPVTLGHMRSQGCRDLLVYCNSGRCNQSTIMNVGHLPDDTRINSLGDGIVCMRCGHLGAEVVPNWPTHASPRSS